MSLLTPAVDSGSQVGDHLGRLVRGRHHQHDRRSTGPCEVEHRVGASDFAEHVVEQDHVR